MLLFQAFKILFGTIKKQKLENKIFKNHLEIEGFVNFYSSVPEAISLHRSKSITFVIISCTKNTFRDY